MNIYLDMVSTEPPQHSKGSGPRWRPHAARIAIAFEADREAPPEIVVALVEPHPDWPLDAAWVDRYLGTRDEPGQPPAEIIDAIAPHMPEEKFCFVAHNWAFHREVLNGMRLDAGLSSIAFAEGEFYDTMRGATDLMRIVPNRPGWFKPPKLAEAFAHFAGAELLAAEALCWRAAALQQIHALRTVFWGIQGWGAPVAAAA